MFDLHFFGRGAAFQPSLGNTNAWFTAGDELFLLDCGESTFEKVVRLPLVTFARVTVLLTHLHADHAGSLPSLCSYMALRMHKTLHIVYPDTRVIAFLTLTGIDPSFYAWSERLGADAPIEAQAVPVEHARDMACYGYVIDRGGARIYYSGDAAALPEAVRQDFLCGRIERIYHDTARPEAKAHCAYPRLCEAIPPEMRARVYCMHLDGDYEPELRALGFSVVTAEP